MPTPEEVISTQRRILLEGGKLTRDQLREGLDAFRQQRITAASTVKKGSAKLPVRSSTELLDLLTKPTGG